MIPESTGQAIAMTHGISSSDLSSFGVLFDMFSFASHAEWAIVSFGFYIFYAYCQYSLSEKLHIKNSWFAFVPILNVINLFQIAQVSLWWIAGFFIPLINLIVIVVLAIKINHGISRRTGHGGWWTVGLIFLNFIMFPLTALTYTPPFTQSDISATPPEPTL